MGRAARVTNLGSTPRASIHLDHGSALSVEKMVILEQTVPVNQTLTLSGRRMQSSGTDWTDSGPNKEPVDP